MTMVSQTHQHPLYDYGQTHQNPFHDYGQSDPSESPV